MQVTNRHQYDAYFATDDLPAWYDKLDKKDKKLGLLLVFISTDDACRAGWKVHPFDDKQKVGAEALQLASPRQRDDDDSSDEEFGVPAEK
ncbi:hypothetical protein CH63R_14451 [Colletotrichum higginsianum IMI 349063]|uniref:Uncharacterized protein n=1 Tax=Colletotrichum higginsianum (strain IMI 349063) TaxID=759273 RepID=A0A1B7XQV9_COLHI|nr:hypothetical protein CH63R_14451 [Colletotrichum higginsianum IMI 349063]OBR02150.1 hypothetical protein CH63R_14451 [Colletotrichum higginsianum IMI 349063]